MAVDSTGKVYLTAEEQLTESMAKAFEASTPELKEQVRAMWLKHQFNAKSEGRDCKLTIVDVYANIAADGLLTKPAVK